MKVYFVYELNVCVLLFSILLLLTHTVIYGSWFYECLQIPQNVRANLCVENITYAMDCRFLYIVHAQNLGGILSKYMF